ncbi:DUF3592 domain-containing protein [Occallatibacter savannae]|uniref:DUF3592 domain-containing protein n=1 Tax=Occallatibacter savannae TaxID=1002691 RepID=UPI000D69DDB6
MILRGSPYAWYALLFVLAGGLAALAFFRKSFVQRLREKRGSDWPTTCAVIDIVRISEEYGSRGEIIGYLCTLTYFYRYPELQSGEYCRSFPANQKPGAEAWAASYKGVPITIYVDPQDPTRSVLQIDEI